RRGRPRRSAASIQRPATFSLRRPQELMGASQHDLTRHRLGGVRRSIRRCRSSAARFSALACAALLAAAGPAAADSGLADLIQAGESEAALARIEAGADVDAAQGDGTTPLHWAVYRLDVALVDALLDAGAEADVVNLYGASPLTEAVKAGHAGLVERLLAAGADVESPNADGQTALMLAARA